MYDGDANTNSTQVKVSVIGNNKGNGSVTSITTIQSASKVSSQRTQVINLTTHIPVPYGCFRAEISHSTNTSPETSVYFYGYQY